MATPPPVSSVPTGGKKRQEYSASMLSADLAHQVARNDNSLFRFLPGGSLGAHQYSENQIQASSSFQFQDSPILQAGIYQMLVEMNELDKLLGNGNQFGAALDTIDPNDIQITVTEGVREGGETEFSSSLTENNLRKHNQGTPNQGTPNQGTPISVLLTEAITERETASNSGSEVSLASLNVGIETKPNGVLEGGGNIGPENMSLQRSSNSGIEAVGFDKKSSADQPSDKAGNLTYKGNCTPPNLKHISKDYPDPISRALAHLAEMIMLTLLHSTQFRTQAVFDGLAKQYQQKLQDLVKSSDAGKEAAAQYINERVLTDGAMDPGIQKALKNALGLPAGIKEVTSEELSVVTEKTKTFWIATGEVSKLTINSKVCEGVKANQIAMNEKKEYFDKYPEGDGKISYEIKGVSAQQEQALKTMDNHSIPAAGPLNGSQQNNIASTSSSASITQANLSDLQMTVSEKLRQNH